MEWHNFFRTIIFFLAISIRFWYAFSHKKLTYRTSLCKCIIFCGLLHISSVSFFLVIYQIFIPVCQFQRPPPLKQDFSLAWDPFDGGAWKRMCFAHLASSSHDNLGDKPNQTRPPQSKQQDKPWKLERLERQRERGIMRIDMSTALLL